MASRFNPFCFIGFGKNDWYSFNSDALQQTICSCGNDYKIVCIKKELQNFTLVTL